MAARWAQAGREAPPRPPTRRTNAPEPTPAPSVKVLLNQCIAHSSTRSCRSPARGTSTPGGSMDARATPTTGPTRQTTYGGVTEPSHKMRRSFLNNMVFLAVTLMLRAARARRNAAHRARERAGHARARCRRAERAAEHLVARRDGRERPVRSSSSSWRSFLFRIAGAERRRRDGQLRVVLAPALAPAHGNARRARLRHLSQSQKSAEGEGPQLLALAGKSWQTRDRLWSRGC